MLAHDGFDERCNSLKKWESSVRIGAILEVSEGIDEDIRHQNGEMVVSTTQTSGGIYARG